MQMSGEAMKLRTRWYIAGEVRSEDYFAVKVPWWLRIKRFMGKPRTEELRSRDRWDEYLDDMADPPEEI